MICGKFGALVRYNVNALAGEAVCVEGGESELNISSMFFSYCGNYSG